MLGYSGPTPLMDSKNTIFNGFYELDNWIRTDVQWISA